MISPPVRLLRAIHEQLSYIRQETAKAQHQIVHEATEGAISRDRPSTTARPGRGRTRTFHAALRVKPEVHHAWFRNVLVRDSVDGKLIVTAPDPYMATYIAAQFSNQIEAAAKAAFGVPKVVVEVAAP